MVLQGDAHEAILHSNDYNKSFIDVYFPSFIEHENTWQRYGSVWLVKYKNKPTFLIDHEKIRYIVHLLDKPNESILAAELYKKVKEGFMTPEQIEKAMEAKGAMKRHYCEDDLGNPDPLLALKKVFHHEFSRADMKRLNAALMPHYYEGGAQWSYIKKILLDEHHMFVREYVNKYGVKKFWLEEMHRSYPEIEKPRTNVKNRIADAIKDIEEVHPKLYRHLLKFIEARTYCRYCPTIKQKVNWFIAFDR